MAIPIGNRCTFDRARMFFMLNKKHMTPPPPDEMSLLSSGNASPTLTIQGQVALGEFTECELPSISKSHSLKVTRFIKRVELKPPSYKRDRMEKLAKAKRKDYQNTSKGSSIAIAICCPEWREMPLLEYQCYVCPCLFQIASYLSSLKLKYTFTPNKVKL